MIKPVEALNLHSTFPEPSIQNVSQATQSPLSQYSHHSKGQGLSRTGWGGICHVIWKVQGFHPFLEETSTEVHVANLTVPRAACGTRQYPSDPRSTGKSLPQPQPPRGKCTCNEELTPNSSVRKHGLKIKNYMSRELYMM